MTDIIFVNPPYEQVSKGTDFLKHIINRSPSIGLLLLAAKSRELGYNTEIIESDLENYTPQEVTDIILDKNPKFVGITLFTVGVFNIITELSSFSLSSKNLLYLPLLSSTLFVYFTSVDFK